MDSITLGIIAHAATRMTHADSEMLRQLACLTVDSSRIVYNELNRYYGLPVPGPDCCSIVGSDNIVHHCAAYPIIPLVMPRGSKCPFCSP